MIFSRSIQVAANGDISFFYCYDCIVCIYIIYMFYMHNTYIILIFLSQLSVDGHLCCFHILTVVHSATMNRNNKIQERVWRNGNPCTVLVGL